ncbi:flagellar basal body protein [Chitinasiproducens palmae]|uniref:Flagellar basal body rod protein FlgB n=1 Tax=Chitinasiproducens palmae TaxID=1770053 RepID=A0A1H2PKR7_9BURK|nr:flagellar basal body protein [Chitinasiproducens palmae]SDV46948.1 flagellar basal-body rod protein FlgB [Chitinasiproducens palmae]
MGWTLSDALGVHARALHVRAERTRVLTANLVNADTPGYQARDFDVEMELSMDDGQAPLAKYRVPYLRRIDGSTVETPVEQAAYAQNAADYEMSLTFVELTAKGLKAAIDGVA